MTDSQVPYKSLSLSSCYLNAGLFQTFPDLPITFQFWQRLWVFRHFLDSSLSFISLKLTWHIFYAFSPNVYYHDSLSQQLRAVWDLLLKIDLEGPTFISCTASSNFLFLRLALNCLFLAQNGWPIPCYTVDDSSLSITRTATSRWGSIRVTLNPSHFLQFSACGMSISNPYIDARK